MFLRESHWCILDVSISQDDYDQEHYSCESEIEPGTVNEDFINEDSEDDVEHWDVNDEEIMLDFIPDDEDQSQDDPQSDNQISLFILKFLLLWSSFYGISAAALNHLIKFLYYVLSLISPTSSQIVSLLTIFPTSLYMLKKVFNVSKYQFEKYVICPKCCSLYTFGECIQTSIAGRLLPKLCNHIAFRNHPVASHRQPCGHRLVKEVILKADKKVLSTKNLLLLSSCEKYIQCSKLAKFNGTM